MGVFERLVMKPIEEFFERVLLFLPNLFSALAILIAGILAGWIVRLILGGVLRLFRLDALAERWGVHRMMERGGVGEHVSSMAARFAGWLTFFSFLIIALGSMNIPGVERLFERFLLYIPNIFVALIIIVLGFIFGTFFGRAALIASVNAGLRMSRLIGNAVRLSIFLFSISVALEQLGIGRETVIIAFAIVFGGVVLALSLAFGLGGSSLAREYMEKKIRKTEERDDISHL